MEIKIGIQSVIEDMKNKSHLETSSIETEKRYQVELGTEKLPEVYLDIESAKSELQTVISPFLEDMYHTYGDDELHTPQDMTLEFKMSPRREDGKSAAMARAIHDYLVHKALELGYTSVNALDLAKTHADLSSEIEGRINKLLYTKKGPKVW